MTEVQSPVAARQTGRLALLDRFVALVALILMMPLLIVIAIAIAIDSGFPVLFAQERLGLHGRRFRVLKFRKFPSTVERNTRPLTLTDDSRFTRVGKFLAKTKLDELPQLWNVLRLDMAIVGPRPEVTDFEACFTGPFRRVLDYRPGIFGPSQAAFRAEGKLYPPDRDPEEFYREVLFPAKGAIDLAYYPSRTFLSDTKWVLYGILAVCGTYRKMRVGLARSPGMPEPTGNDVRGIRHLRNRNFRT
jgi:lipopolysaccharide/colanic/teichoic acid biosynthesis glycosyltransferase